MVVWTRALKEALKPQYVYNTLNILPGNQKKYLDNNMYVFTLIIKKNPDKFIISDSFPDCVWIDSGFKKFSQTDKQIIKNFLNRSLLNFELCHFTAKTRSFQGCLRYGLFRFNPPPQITPPSEVRLNILMMMIISFCIIMRYQSQLLALHCVLHI